MKIATYISALIFSSMLMTGCATYYNLNQKSSNLYTSEQLKLLKTSTKAIEFDYGYDINAELEYIISYKHSETNLSKNKTKFFAVFQKIDKKDLFEFYKKIFKLNSKTMYLIREYKKDKIWNYYTYLNKYLYPSLRQYTSLLEEYIATVDKSYLANDSYKIAINRKIDHDMKIEKMKKQRMIYKVGKR